MNKDKILFYSILGFAILGLSVAIINPFDLDLVYAQQEEIELIKIQDSKSDYYFDNAGQLHKSTHGTKIRMFDHIDNLGNPVYVPYKQYDNGNQINFESAYNSYSLDKTTCVLNELESGKITENSAITKTLSHTMKYAIDQTDDWFTVQDDNCSITVQDKKFIISKTINALNVGYDLVYDFTDSGKMEWTYIITNTNPELNNHKFGYTFVCDGSECDQTTFDVAGNNQREIIVNGRNMTKAELINPMTEVDHPLFESHIIRFGNDVFELKEEQHGYTWALKKEPNKTIVDFTHASKLNVGDTLIIDPTIIASIDSSEDNRQTDFGGFGNPDSRDNSGVDHWNFKSTPHNRQEWAMTSFDISGIPTNVSSIESFILNFDNTRWSTSNDNNGDCLLYDLDNPPSIETNITDMHTDGTSGVLLGTIPEDECSNPPSTQTGLTYTFGDDAKADLLEKIQGGGGWWGFYMDKQWKMWSVPESGIISNLTIDIQYSTATIAGKPTGLTNEALPYLINGTWTGCASDGNVTNTCSLVTGVSLWNTTNSHYAEIELPENAGSDAESGSVSDALDFSSNEILLHLNSLNDNDQLIDSSGSNNNATLFDLSRPILTEGLFENSTKSFPMNFSSSDTLMESTQNSQIGAFARLNTTSDFNLLAYNVTGNTYPTEIGFNDTHIYIRYNGNDVLAVDNDCNLFSWCFYGIDRNGSVFSITQNDTITDTPTSSQDLGNAVNDMFFIGGNATLLDNEILTGNLDEFYINDASDTAQIINIADRGFDNMTWLANYGNQTYAECTGGIEQTVYCRVKLMNSIGNGTASDLIYGTTDGLPDSPSLTANGVSTSQIDILRTAGASNGGDIITHFDLRCEVNNTGGWLSTQTNATIANFYNYTGLSQGDSLTCQWRDRNGVGYSNWSANATGNTFENLSAIISFNSTLVNDAILITPKANLETGYPSPTLTKIELLNNTDVLETVVESESLTNDNSTVFLTNIGKGSLGLSGSNFSIRATINNGSDYLFNSSSLNVVALLSPDYQTSDNGHIYNFTHARNNQYLDLNVTRNADSSTLNCQYVDLNHPSGSWINETGTPFYYQTYDSGSGDAKIHVRCYNPSLLVFSFSSFNTNGTAKLANLGGLDAQLGSWMGIPLAGLFIIVIASMATKSSSPVIMFTLVVAIGIMGTIGFFTIDAGLFALIMIMGILGIVATKLGVG